MKIVLVALTAIALLGPLAVAAISTPAQAQRAHFMEKRAEQQKKAVEQKKKTQEIDQAYRETTASQPGQALKTNDPWANMR